MRELKVGETGLPVTSTPVAQLFYRQEFGSDMTRDYLRVMSGFVSAFPEGKGKTILELAVLATKDFDAGQVTLEDVAESGFDVLGVLQLVWAMAKAAQFPAQSWPPFADWLASLDGVDILDEDFLLAALEVAAEGLFPGAGSKQPKL